jgi:hypothetical protein
MADVLARFLACGDLRHGFARVRCGDCKHEYLLAFSCKAYCFCPTCHQKRALLFGEWVDAQVLREVVHRQYTFTIYVATMLCGESPVALRVGDRICLLAGGRLHGVTASVAGASAGHGTRSSSLRRAHDRSPLRSGERGKGAT